MDYQAFPHGSLGSIYFRPNPCNFIGQKCSTHIHGFDHTTFFVSRTRAKKWRPAVTEAGVEVLGPDGKPLWLLILDQVFEAGEWLYIAPHEKHSFETVPEIVPHFLLDFIAKCNASDEEKAAVINKLENNPVGFVCMYSHRHPQSGEVVVRPNGNWRAFV